MALVTYDRGPVVRFPTSSCPARWLRLDVGCGEGPGNPTRGILTPLPPARVCALVRVLSRICNSGPAGGGSGGGLTLSGSISIRVEARPPVSADSSHSPPKPADAAGSGVGERSANVVGTLAGGGVTGDLWDAPPRRLWAPPASIDAEGVPRQARILDSFTALSSSA